jgi:hypothetical protein
MSDPFWPNDIYRIAFGVDGYLDIGVSKDHILCVKVKGTGETNGVRHYHHLTESDAKELWVELFTLFQGLEDAT